MKKQFHGRNFRYLSALAVAVALSLAGSQARCAEQTYAHIKPITIHDNTNAAPYPSTILVSGFPQAVEKVSVTISGFTHFRPEDVDILLVGPTGRSVILLSDAGAGPNSLAVSNVTLNFDDDALVQLRDQGQITTGTYRPSDYPPADSFPQSTPSGPYATELSAFRETNPNGSWRLYVVDDEGGNAGFLGGWSLTIAGHSQVFANTNRIDMPPNSLPATPYPSVIQVPNVAGKITKVTVTLNAIEHTYAEDIDVLLVGPTGESVVLMSDAGGGFDLNKVTLVFDDSAPASLPTNSIPQSGRFRPTNYGGSDSFPPPAPGGSYGSDLSVFNGQQAGGAWRLFVVDDVPQVDGGAILGGWKLAISTEPLAITQQPIAVQTLPGSNALFHVAVAGMEPITYQWRLNDMPIPGATNSVLHFPQVSVANGGSYSVSIRNPSGVIESRPVPLLLAYPLYFAPDNFAQLTQLSNNFGLKVGTNFFKSKEPGEPWHAGKPGGSSVWYSWTPASTGIATFDTRGSTFDTLLAVYTGNSFSNLTLVARDEDSGGFFTSRTSFNVSANQSYLIAVDGLVGDQGFFALSWVLEITTELLPSLSRPIPGQTVPLGSNATMSVSGSAPGLRYQWSLNGIILPGATNSSLAISNVQPPDVGTYQVEGRTASGRRVLSEPMVLEIGPFTTIQSRAKRQDVSFIEAFYSVPPSGMAIAASLFDTNPFVAVRAGTSSGVQIIHTYGGGAAAPGACTRTLSPTRYFGLEAVDDGDFIVHNTGSSIRTVLQAHVFDEFGDLDCIAESIGLSSYLRFSGRRGARYILVAAAEDSAATGIVHLNWAFGLILSVAVTNKTNAVVSWRHAPATGYQLQSSLHAAGPWETVMGSTLLGSTFTPPNTNVFLPVIRTGEPFPPRHRLFRLRRP